MPITEADFKSIANLVSKMVGKKGEYFTTGRVIKRDESRNLVWLAEFGDQAIPIVGFQYKVKYYDTSETGDVVPKTAIASPITPAIGEIVIVAREFASNRLPRCLGVLQGTGWITPPEN